MYKFALKIDDDDHSLTKENGIPFGKVGELLQNLYAAIDPDSKIECTLGQIRGNCYALDFYTDEIKYHENFIVVHKNIEDIPLDELSPIQRKYATTLKKILGAKYFIKAYDNDNVQIAKIKQDPNKVEKDALKSDVYFSQKTVYGIVSELGGASLNSSKKHIKVDGIPYNIKIDKDQDIQLKPFYGTDKLRIKIRQKRSQGKGRIIDAELISFVSVRGNTIIDNLKNEGYIDFDLIKNTHTIEELVDKIHSYTNEIH